jgi:hypothetical protein
VDVIKDALYAATVTMLATELAVCRCGGEPTEEQVIAVMDEFFARATKELASRFLQGD